MDANGSDAKHPLHLVCASPPARIRHGATSSKTTTKPGGQPGVPRTRPGQTRPGESSQTRIVNPLHVNHADLRPFLALLPAAFIIMHVHRHPQAPFVRHPGVSVSPEPDLRITRGERGDGGNQSRANTDPGACTRSLQTDKNKQLPSYTSPHTQSKREL